MRINRAEPLRYYHLREENLSWLDRLVVRRQRDEPNFNRQMFVEDFSRLFNLVGHEKGKLFDITSNDEQLTQALLANIEIRSSRYARDETIKRWVEEIAQALVRLEKAQYFLSDKDENGKIYINSFASRGVFHLPGTLIQWLPQGAGTRWNRDGDSPREIRILDSSRVLSFGMPKAIKRMLRAQNRTLAVIDRHQYRLSAFHPQATHENPNPTNHFDFNAWNDTMDRVFYRATRATGWNGRKYDSSKRSDFFDCHRIIRFRRNQLLLRDDILRQIGTELSKVGAMYKADFEVDVTGSASLTSVKQLNELETRLTREEVGFNEVVDCCFER